MQFLKKTFYKQNATCNTKKDFLQKKSIFNTKIKKCKGKLPCKENEMQNTKEQKCIPCPTGYKSDPTQKGRSCIPICDEGSYFFEVGVIKKNKLNRPHFAIF